MGAVGAAAGLGAGETLRQTRLAGRGVGRESAEGAEFDALPVQQHALTSVIVFGVDGSADGVEGTVPFWALLHTQSVQEVEVGGAAEALGRGAAPAVGLLAWHALLGCQVHVHAEGTLLHTSAPQFEPAVGTSAAVVGIGT